jgi:cytochrome c oxidase subunit 1
VISLRGEKVSDNPWQATTLEWSAPSPPPHGNFTKTPHVHREPYDYRPDAPEGFVSQTQPM